MILLISRGYHVSLAMGFAFVYITDLLSTKYMLLMGSQTYLDIHMKLEVVLSI